MGAVFKIASGVPCRACGAVLAPEGRNEVGLCGNCWTSVKMHCGLTFDLRRRVDAEPGLISEDEVNSWLAQKLVKDLKRLAKTGIVGRCEAVSGWGYGNPGTQCGLAAIRYRDEHKVCAKHHGATSPVYVSDRRSDQYEMLKGLLSDLAKKDPQFRKAMEDSL